MKYIIFYTGYIKSFIDSWLSMAFCTIYRVSCQYLQEAKILLDLLGERKPYYDPIAKLATLAEY